MLLIVICFYAAFAASVAVVLLRLALLFARKSNWLRGVYSIVLVQMAFGVAYMVALNIDAGPSARIDWVIAIICGLVGGTLSLVVAIPVTRVLDRAK